MLCLSSLLRVSKLLCYIVAISRDLSYCDLYRWMLGWGVWGNEFLDGRAERSMNAFGNMYDD
jgi:hypothetical protein